ncbi:hypothetical protein MTX78_19030 [Hymenobacter tibetensis]|uniref:DUF1295 domain-containing protein n=1 Tax=Hymenobacter tibetensis TaxID=497967 RepID=A0ABY4CVJ0_9BACT|nr:hypothetical protein [Hymenobacter tibetensis]UOG74203.1 hypothetical protein MTX78_19030 [Hymenobacter tibetensis]
MAFLLLLGWPWLLAGWAFWRLRSAQPAGGLGRAYLLACYAASVQVNAAHVRGERVFPFVHFVVASQAVALYTALYLLLRWRSLPASLSVASVLLVTWLTYRYLRPVVEHRLRAWGTVDALENYPPAQRRAWGLLGHTCFWGAFTFIFICLGLHGKLAAWL